MSTSNRLIPLQRTLDRLPPGQYTITLIIPHHRRAAWDIQISQSIPLTRLSLTQLPPLEPLPTITPDKLTF